MSRGIGTERKSAGHFGRTAGEDRRCRCELSQNERWERQKTVSGLRVTAYLGLLTGRTLTDPVFDLFVHLRPEIASGYQALRRSLTGV